MGALHGKKRLNQKGLGCLRSFRREGKIECANFLHILAQSWQTLGHYRQRGSSFGTGSILVVYEYRGHGQTWGLAQASRSRTTPARATLSPSCRPAPMLLATSARVSADCRDSPVPGSILFGSPLGGSSTLTVGANRKTLTYTFTLIISPTSDGLTHNQQVGLTFRQHKQ